MRRDELIEAVRASPFRPFRLYVADRGTFEIRHPEMLMVMRHTTVVGSPENGGPAQSPHGYPAIERHTVIDLVHITQLEQLPSQTRPT
jgi:hypothetical protein